MGNKVLILEDDADIALLSERVLSDAGLEVRVADTVDEALQACVESPPDLVLVDLQLPERSGWDFVREVRSSSRWPNMRIAIFTVHFDEPEFHREAKDLKVDAFLGKSPDPEELVASVRRLLG